MQENQPDTTNSAQGAVQKPPTKVFILQVGRTRYYNIYVEAESKEQAEKAWEANGFEYSALHQPDYEWEPEEFMGVHDYDGAVENAEVSYNEVRSALGLEELEEEG